DGHSVRPATAAVPGAGSRGLNYFRRVLRYLRPHWKLAAFSVFLMIVGSLVGLLLPWPFKFLVDNVLQNEPLSPTMAGLLGSLADHRTRLLIVVVTAGLVLTLLQNGLSVLDNYVNTKVEQHMILDFRS